MTCTDLLVYNNSGHKWGSGATEIDFAAIDVTIRAAVKGATEQRLEWGHFKDWAQVVAQADSEAAKWNKHRALENGPVGQPRLRRGVLLPLVISTHGAISPDTLRFLYFLGMQQCEAFLRSRNWDQDKKWVNQVRSRFFQQVKGRLSATQAVASALRLHPLPDRFGSLLPPRCPPLASLPLDPFAMDQPPSL